jgi:hypothetical protein
LGDEDSPSLRSFLVDQGALLRGSVEHVRRTQGIAPATIYGNFVGSASISKGHEQSTDKPFAHFSYVIDTSGSVAASCDDNRNVFECEKDAIIALNKNMTAQLDVALGISIIDFDDSAQALEFLDSNSTGQSSNLHLVDPHNYETVRETIDTQTGIGGNTYFIEALKMANTIVGEAKSAYQDLMRASFVIFLSDGINNGADPTDEIQKILASGTRVFSFAIGVSSSCTGYLDKMATDTGGSCEEVIDPSELEEKLLQTILQPRTLDGVELVINSEPLAYSSNPNLASGLLTPDQSPTKITADPIPIELFGSYNLCIEAKSLNSTAGCCVQFNYTEEE